MCTLKLYGFNNLTKSLSFNIYDVCYAKSVKEQKEYIEYIDEQYNSDRLTQILRDVTDIIGAHILNISKQDYDPQGASVNDTGDGGAPQNPNGRSQSWETRWSQNHLHDRLHWRVDLFAGCLHQECQGDADGGRCQEAVKAGGTMYCLADSCWSYVNFCIAKSA